MAILALVGNAPSSGSTFLSDLLDCTPRSASGPELNLFSNPHLYDFERFRAAPRRCGRSASVHTARNCIVRGALPAYGMDAQILERMVERSADFPEFAERFAARFLALRGKAADGAVFEKTPQNINAIGQFLAAYPQGWFVYAIRNPLHVYESLVRRGFPRWIALTSWLVDVAQFLQYKTHPRVILVRYEELVHSPYKVVAGILRRVCGSIDLGEEEFMESYRHNSYTRIFSERVDTWTVKDTGVVKDANRRHVPESVRGVFAASLALRVNPEYAGIYGFESVTVQEAIEKLGYAEVIREALANVCPERSALRADWAAYRLLMKKSVYAFLSGSPSGRAIRASLRPVIISPEVIPGEASRVKA